MKTATWSNSAKEMLPWAWTTRSSKINGTFSKESQPPTPNKSWNNWGSKTKK